ncbi:DUF948 domain-containing protein [Bacillus pumilus]|uniref:DUF948 domain-containing protein n=1 Tax=Bacillus TaxID=1386 RepID=UPI00165811AC|nr:DUF948 domain-containing protein [Bacillus pumilus]QNP15435.1 DUF948 domain-containing protein [Bacillus pumilus]
MIIILYLSVALIAIAFLILVIHLSKTLKSLQLTLKNVASTLEGLEGQMQGITTETTQLLHKTNQLAEDIQDKSAKLNTVVDAVQGIGGSINQFNTSIKQAAGAVSSSVERNQEKVTDVVSWSNAALEIYKKWKQRKHQK